MRSILAAALVCTFFTQSSAQVPGQTVRELVGHLERTIPEGWTVIYNQECQCLEVKRTEPVLAYSSLVNEPALSPEKLKPEAVEVDITFQVSKRLTDEARARIHAQNLDHDQQRKALYKVLIDKKLSRKFDSFFAKTEEDRQLESKYEMLKKARQNLPEHFYRDISLNRLAYAFTLDLVDEQVRQEFAAVEGLVLDMLSKHQYGEQRRDHQRGREDELSPAHH